MVRGSDLIFDANQEMKMIAQQAIDKCIGHRFNVPGVESQEIGIVALLQKDVFPVVASVVDVIILAGLEGDWFGHRFSCALNSDLAGFKNLSGLLSK